MRLPGWRTALRQYLAAARGKIFTSYACAGFISGAVQAMTGQDPSAMFGAYDEARALELLKQYGGVTGLATAAFGEPLAPNLCQEGDVVEASLERGPTLGICFGVTCAFAGARGPVHRPRSVVTRGWRVP